MAPVPQELPWRKCERTSGAYIDQGPATHGWDVQRWTPARINRLVNERFGTCFADFSGAWRMLDRLGWFWQALTARAIERDEEEIAAWCTQVWPGTKRER